MKTIHTIYTNFAKRLAMVSILLTYIGVAAAWGETLTLSNLGKNISTASNDVKTTTIVATGDNTDSYILNYKQCSSQSNSGNYAMFLKKGAEPFISNKTPIPGNIKSVTIYILTGASSSTSYHCAFSTTECTSVYTNGSTAQTISGGSSKKYECEVDNAKYFCISLGNNSNGQVWKIDVEYEVVSGSSYTVNWYVNGSKVHTQTDIVGTVLSSMPTPTKLDCDNEKVFVGWTTSAYSHATTAPSTLITNTSGMTIPEGGADYHAVFAKPNPNGTEQRTVTLSPPETENATYKEGTQLDSENNIWTYYATINNEYGNICFGLNSNEKNYNIGSPVFGGHVTSVSFKAHNGSTTESRKFLFCSSNSTAQPQSGDLAEVTIPKGGSSFNHTTYTADLSQSNVSQFYIYVIEALRITDISVTYKCAYSNYTTNCAEIITYNVIYEANDKTSGTVPIDNNEYESGETVTVKSHGDLAKIGYTFAGWKRSDNSDIVQDNNTFTMPASDLTLTAQWTAKEYDIIYKDQNDADFSGNHQADYPTKHTYGTATTLKDATKTGYTFGGWYKEPECTTNNVTTLGATDYTSDITIYAKWTPNTYTVQFNANGGTGTMGSQSFTYDVAQNLSENTYTRTGYNFTGWNTAADGTGTSYADKAEVQNLTSEPNGVVTLHAQWNAKPLTNFRTSCSYTVIWQANGGQWSDGKTEDIEEEYNVGETITPPDEPTRDGYTFAGWEPEVPATMPAENQTFKAIWENCRWVETTTIEDGDEIVFIMVDNPTSTSYAMNNEVTSTDPLAVVINTDIFSSGNVPNNIIWDIQKDANGIVFYSKTAADNSIYCTKSYTRVGVNSANTFALYKGYIQNLSYDDSYLAVATGATTKYWHQYAYSSNNITNQTLKLYKRICLDDTKHWVTWDANGGLFADGSATKTDFFTVGATITHPANPTREGHTFAGWSPTTSTVGDEDITFVAQWQVNTYTVTWNANGGKFGNETSVEQSYPYGAPITAPTPTRIGYTFAGWDSEVPTTMPASNLTYNAQWNCTSPTDIKINGAYIVFPGETIELTVTGNNIADDATYQWYKKNGDSYDELEEQTTNTLRIDNCVVGDAANYKCVVTNGTCSAENNFTVKMYRLRGLTDPENSWTTDFVFSKAEGKTATYEITLNGASNYKFKVHDGSAYYGNNEGGDNPNPTMTHDNCTNWTMQENKGYNVILQTTITGVYTFVLDYTDESNPKISVIYPKKKIIYLNPNIWDAGNATEYYTVYSWGTAGSEFVPMELADCNGKVYMAEIDAAHTQVIFIRDDRYVNNFENIWNQTVDIPLNANKPQYRIDGWGDNNNGNKSYGGWEQYTPYYTISYNMNGHGTQIADDCVEDGHAWDAPTDPTAVGYTFLGWRRPATTNDNTLYKYGQTGFTPTANEELTAQWSFSMEYAITGTANVTSAVEQTIKATTPLQLAVSNMPVGTKVAISAPNITFYDEAGNAITEVATKSNPEQFNLTIAYTPTVENTTEQPTITLSVLGNEKTFDGHISARSLPNTFAIVAKVGNLWYALPSQGLNSITPPAAYPVEVDDMADPTAVTAVPENADWSLRGVYEASRSDATKDRYVANGDNLVFVNNASPAMTLNASSSEEENYLLTDAQYNNYYSTNPGLYEWTPTTTDLETYQLTNEQRSRKLSVNTATIFGVHAQNKAVEQVRFLPIQNRYTPAALQVVEWKENSIVVMYNGDPAQTASVSVNGAAAQNTKLSDEQSQCDIAVYELAATGLAANPTQRLSITIGTDKVILPIPYIISGAQTDLALLPGSTVAARQEVAKVADLVILKDAMLTAAGSKSDPYKFRNVTIYGGGKLVIPSEKGFGVSSLTMRVGAVESGNYKALYPQLVLNGSINTGNINIDYLTTYDRYYALSLPYQADTRDILYPAEIYGDNLKTGNKASFALQWYNGEARASETRKGWTDLQEPATLEPYKGYTFWGAPRKVSVNGESKRQNFGIHRIPIKPKAIDLITGETTGKQINVYAHPAVNAYDAGWNFLGNPYLAQYGNMEDEHTSGLLGMLTQNPETGVWEHTGNYRYITLTDDGKTYWQTPVSEAELYPFNTFFVQAGENGAVSFNASNRASLPARHYAAQQVTAKEITTGIILTGNDQTDRTGLLIADNFTEEYDFNADLSKFENSGINLYTIGKTGNLAYMAINQTLAEQPIPVGYSAPAEGLYTIAFDEDRYNATDISALYLIDYDSNEKTNLLHTDYSFVTAAGTNNQRFALQVAFVPANSTNVEWVGDATIQVGVDGHELILNNLPTDATVHVFDALGRLMYHTPHALTEMQLTLPTGYYLVRIADKQHAVVTNIVIP